MTARTGGPVRGHSTVHDLLLSTRFRAAWERLSREEMSPEDREASINGVVRMLSAGGLTLADVLAAAVEGSRRRAERTAGTAKADPHPARSDDAPVDPARPPVRRSGLSGLSVEVRTGDGEEEPAKRRAHRAYSDVAEAETARDLPRTLTGTVRIDDERSNPRAAYGVAVIVADEREFGPVMLYGSDLDAARDAINHRRSVEGRVVVPSNPESMPTLVDVRAVA